MKMNFAMGFGCVAFCFSLLILAPASDAQSDLEAEIHVTIWPGLAPGETRRDPGTTLPAKPQDKPTITRIENISQPTLDVYEADNPNGTAALILPGGGFRYVVPDLEGSELAAKLNEAGVTAFVLNYRVSGDTTADAWKKPAQDSQRAMRWIRAKADKYSIDPQRVGLIGFSAGGQVAAWHMSRSEPLYDSLDEVDEQSFTPDFGVLVYAWQLLDESASPAKLKMPVGDHFPRTLLVHTSDDQAADAQGAALLYSHLLRSKVDAELHIYRSGGHGYGTRKREESVIHKWPSLLLDWMKLQDLL